MSEDKRKHNGGHSTAPKRATDRRLNPFKHVLKDALTPEEIKKVIKATYKKAIEGDTRAATLIMNYYLGKPDENIALSANGDIQFTLKKLVSFSNENIEEAKEVD